MSDDEIEPPAPTCHGCTKEATVSYRVKPRGRDSVPTTINACKNHEMAARKIGFVLKTTTHGAPTIKKLK